MKLGMERNVFASLDSSKLMDGAELVTLIQHTMVLIVFVTLDSLEIETNVKNVTQLAQNVLDQMKTNVLFAQM